jgi:hypothetical protein
MHKTGLDIPELLRKIVYDLLIKKIVVLKTNVTVKFNFNEFVQHAVSHDI